MSFDVLTPEFMQFAEKVKAIYEKKEQKTKEFKALWEKHKKEIAELEAEADKLKQQMFPTDKDKKDDAKS